MARQVFYKQDIRERFVNGMKKLADAVTSTLGPRGRTVIFGRGAWPPEVTKDGVTVAKEIKFKDPLENLGARMLKEAAQKTADNAGDGTTLTTLLAYNLIQEGFKEIDKGKNPVQLVEELKKEMDYIKGNVNSVSKKFKDEDLLKVATISSNSEELGQMIATTVAELGKDAVYLAEENPTYETKVEIVKGLQFNRGFISPYMVNNPQKMEAVFGNVPILLTDKTISSVPEIAPILEAMVKKFDRKEIVIIAEDVVGDALASLLLSNVKNTFRSVCVKIPGSLKEEKQAWLEDIACFTGGTIVDSLLNLKSENIDTSIFGFAEKVQVNKKVTTIVEGKGSKEEMDKRIKMLEHQIEIETDKFKKEKLGRRLGALVAGTAMFKIGGATKMEATEKKMRVDDALLAIQSAMEGGIVEGGGCALWEAANKCKNKLLKKVLKKHFYKLCENSGIVLKKPNYGFDFKEGSYVDDMFEEGIVDPTKVILEALSNSFSIASLVLTTENLVVDLGKDIKKPDESVTPDDVDSYE